MIRSMSRWKTVCVAIVLLGFVPLVDAHEILPTVVDVELGKKEAVLTYSLSLEPILAGIDLSQHNDSETAPEAQEYDRLRALPADQVTDLFSARFDEFAELFVVQKTGGLALSADRIVVNAGDTDEEGAARIATLVLNYTFGRAAPDSVAVGLAPTLGALIVRYNAPDGSEYNAFLTNGDLSAPLSVPAGGFFGRLFGK